MSAKALTWEQITAWRMSQQGLLQRAGKERWLETAARIGGLHAQVMSAAELAVWARADEVEPADIQRALWEEKTLAKTWAMRGTLHLVPTAKLPEILLALRESVSAFYRRASWLNYHGVTMEQLDAIIEGAGAVLGSEPMTREQLADAIVERTGHTELKELLMSGWGALLKPAAHEGKLLFGPSQGQNVTFVSPEKWLSGWRTTGISTEDALQEVVRRYLSVYGPATYEEFGKWWGVDASKAKKLFRSLGDEVVPVKVEGWEGWVLQSTVSDMHNASIPNGTVRLLPHFDPYTVSMSHRSQYVLDDMHKPLIYRSQGWIYPAIVVDGRMAGVWELEKNRKQIELKLEWFEQPRLSPAVRSSLEEEASRLAAFYDTDIMMRG